MAAEPNVERCAVWTKPLEVAILGPLFAYNVINLIIIRRPCPATSVLSTKRREVRAPVHLLLLRSPAIDNLNLFFPVIRAAATPDPGNFFLKIYKMLYILSSSCPSLLPGSCCGGGHTALLCYQCHWRVITLRTRHGDFLQTPSNWVSFYFVEKYLDAC